MHAHSEQQRPNRCSGNDLLRCAEAVLEKPTVTRSPLCAPLNSRFKLDFLIETNAFFLILPFSPLILRHFSRKR